VVEFGLTAIKNEFMQCLFLSIGAKYTSILSVFTNNLGWANVGAMQLGLLYIHICHDTCYRAHFVQFSLNVLDPNHHALPAKHIFPSSYRKPFQNKLLNVLNVR
jgi:hypothetical protein